MVGLERRAMIRQMGVATIAVPAWSMLVSSAFAEEDLYVPSRYENFKRGTINSLDPRTRGLVVILPDASRVKMKAADMVVKTSSGYPGNAYSELREGQTVDIHWFDYLDFLIAKTTPETTAHAKAMVAQGARIDGIPGSEHQIRLFSMAGMVVATDPQHATVDIINASGGEPDKPAPDSGEVIRLPQIQSENGRGALTGLKPGDKLTTVYSVQTAFKVVIIR